MACGKKETEPEPIPAPPSPGGASQDLVNTRLGTGLGLNPSLAPTSTKWERVFVVDGKTAIIVGTALDEAIALRTTDKGRNWEALRAKPGKFASWGVGADGSTALIGGDRRKAKVAKGVLRPVEKAQVWFAPAGRSLSEPAKLFPNDDELKNVSIESGFAMPAVHSGELVGTVADRQRSNLLVFGVPGGEKQPPPLTPARAKMVMAPFGRPPQLLTERGASFEVAPWPKPGEKVASGKAITGLGRVNGAYEQLSMGPGCEFGKWSFARLDGGTSNTWVVGVSPDKSFAFKVPGGEVKTIGCGPDAVVVETIDAKKKVPQLVRCTFDGKCAAPQSQPFEIWPEEHNRTIVSTATKQGVVAVMTARAGARWANHLATSMDGGKTFDLPRLIGEGATDRGLFEIGAVIGFEDSVVILLSADVTGTRRRGWYVLSSRDGGQTWGEP